MELEIVKMVAKEGFLAFLVVFLLYRLINKESALLDAYREGAEHSRKMMEAIDKMSVALVDLRNELRRK